MSIQQGPDSNEAVVASLQGIDTPPGVSEAPGEAPEYRDGITASLGGSSDGHAVVSPLSSETGDGLVKVAYLHRDEVSHSFHESMLGLWQHDLWSNGRVTLTEGPIRISCSGPNSLVAGRNLATTFFLDNTPHEWLLFIDTDMGFKPDSVDRLVAAADPITRPVMGALCFAYMETEVDGYGGRRYQPVPTLFGLAKSVDGHIGFVNRYIYPRDTVLQVAGTGAAFLLIHRSVLQALRAEHGDHWFDLVAYGNGLPVSEDLSFCWRVGSLGIPLFVHTGVRTTHHKSLYVAEQDYVMPDVEPQFTRASP